jgi:hypothetical protein
MMTQAEFHGTAGRRGMLLALKRNSIFPVLSGTQENIVIADAAMSKDQLIPP